MTINSSPHEQGKYSFPVADGRHQRVQLHHEDSVLAPYSITEVLYDQILRSGLTGKYLATLGLCAGWSRCRCIPSSEVTDTRA